MPGSSSGLKTGRRFQKVSATCLAVGLRVCTSGAPCWARLEAQNGFIPSTDQQVEHAEHAACHSLRFSQKKKVQFDLNEFEYNNLKNLLI